MNLSDQYHDEQGRPLAPPAPPASKPTEAWRETLRARAAAVNEARALGPLANTPQAIAAFHRDRAIKAKGLAAAALAGAGPQPPQADDAPQPLAAPPPGGLDADLDSRREADLIATQERIAIRSAHRREGARIAAATVRARRVEAAIEKATNDAVAAAIDRAQERYHREQAIAQAEAAELAANPGILTARGLLALARDNNLEAELYRFAHISRAPRLPSQWPPAFRRLAELEIQNLVANRRTRKPKGAKK
jgi:hypothetical protein